MHFMNEKQSCCNLDCHSNQVPPLTQPCISLLGCSMTVKMAGRWAVQEIYCHPTRWLWEKQIAIIVTIFSLWKEAFSERLGSQLTAFSLPQEVPLPSQHHHTLTHYWVKSKDQETLGDMSCVHEIDLCMLEISTIFPEERHHCFMNIL